MPAGYFFLLDEADFSLMSQLADRGYVVIPMTPAMEQALSGASLPGASVADGAVRTAAKQGETEAEKMADELTAAIESEAPELLTYEGLDMRAALFHGIYHYLAIEVAFARHVATRVAGRVSNGTKVAMGDDGLLSELVASMMAELDVEVNVLAGKTTPVGKAAQKSKVGAMRTLARDVRLLGRKAPRRPQSDRARLAMLATGPTQPGLILDVVRILGEQDGELELYGSNFDVEAPEGVDVSHTGRLDDYSVRTISSMRRRARHYRTILAKLDAIRHDLDPEHWRWTDALVETRLPVIVDRVSYYADQALRFTETVRPDLIVMMDEKSLLSRLLPRACAASGVPTLDVQHGVLTSEPSLRGVAYSKLAVFGESTRDLLIERGVEPDTIEVTGCPRFDALAAAMPAPRDKVLAGLGLNRSKPVVMAATQPVKYTITSVTKYEFVSGLVEAVQAGVFQLIIKKHPYETDDIVERTAKGTRGVAVTSGGDLADLIRASDAVTTIHSTVALEALVLDRPVVVYQPAGTAELVPYCSEEAAELAQDAEGLRRALASVIGGGPAANRAKRDAFLARHLLLDGNSAHRIADLALSLAGGAGG